MYWLNGQTAGSCSKETGTRVKALAPVLVLTLGTDKTIIIVWSQWTGRNRCGKHGVKINRLFFTQGFVGQQIDLKIILNLTGNQWRERSSGILRVNGRDFVTGRTSWFCTRYEDLWGQWQQYHTQKWIAIIKMTTLVVNTCCISLNLWYSLITGFWQTGTWYCSLPEAKMWSGATALMSTWMLSFLCWW